MKKKRASTGRIRVEVGVFGQDPEVLRLSKGTTVEEAIEEAGISITNSTIPYVNGSEADFEDVLHEGDTVGVVSRKQAGR